MYPVYDFMIILTKPHRSCYNLLFSQCCARYYLEDSIFTLKIQDSILFCVFKILFKSILTKRKILFEDTFHKILFYIV